MSAADIFWQGNYSAFRDLVGERSHSLLRVPLAAALQQSKRKTGFREGFGFSAEILKSFDPIIHIAEVGVSANEISEVSEEAVIRATAGIDALVSKVKAFRGTLGGDLTSMKAASDRINAEVTKMQQAYSLAQSLLSTPEFSRAVDNAERLVIALEKIQALTETRISVAIFGEPPTTVSGKP